MRIVGSRWATCILATAGLLAVAPVVPAATDAGRWLAGLAGQQAQPPAGGFAISPDRRPFRHDAHRAVACGTCHRPDERHRDLRRWTARDCEACHHGDATPAGCTSCHERAEFVPPRRSPTPMALSVWPGSRVRDLVFEHERHDGIGCLDCHRGGMRVPAEHCSACHTDHHRPEAECASCHVPPAPDVHGLAAHLTCGGAGCHSSEATLRPMHSRTSCLVCHTEQRDHRPRRDCVACHVKPGPRGPGTEQRDGRL
jgi:hypothetical protein